MGAANAHGRTYAVRGASPAGREQYWFIAELKGIVRTRRAADHTSCHQQQQQPVSQSFNSFLKLPT